MTENKAKEYMENEVECIKKASHCDRDCLNCELVKEETPLIESYGMAIKALEEIQQYRAIGTVEDIADGIKQSEEEFNMLMEYLNIGTIEEFKALKEKSVAKKPKKSGVTDSNGVFHAINGINGVPYDLCPNCEINLCTDGMFGGNRDRMKYCKNCGQKLDFAEDWT